MTVLVLPPPVVEFVGEWDHNTTTRGYEDLINHILLLLDIKPAVKNVEIYNLKYYTLLIIKVELPITRTIIQCTRCPVYNHN
jgi:hypothetical protein